MVTESINKFVRDSIASNHGINGFFRVDYIGYVAEFQQRSWYLGGSKFESPSNRVGNSIFGTVLTEQLELVTGWNPNRIRRSCWVYKVLGE